MTFIDCRTLVPREVALGFRGRFVHGHDMTLAIWEIEPGSDLPDHSHVQEQIVMVLSGEFELTAAGEKQVLTPDTVAVVRAAFRPRDHQVSGDRRVPPGPRRLSMRKCCKDLPPRAADGR